MGKYAKTDLFNLDFMNEESKAQKEQAFRIENIELDKIVLNSKNQYSIDKIEEMKFSILHNGLKQNLEVSDNHDGTYSLISGERRYTALKELRDEGYNNFIFAPCLITDISKSASFKDANGNEILTDDEKETWAIITTNAESREYTDADRAFQVRELKKLYKKLSDNGVKLPGKMSQLIAEELQISETNVKRMSYIDTHGTDELKEKFQNNEISLGAAMDVAHLTPEEQVEVLKNNTVTSTTVKEHKEKIAEHSSRTLPDTVKLKRSDTFIKYLKQIKESALILNEDFNIEISREDYELLMIYTKKLNRVLGDFNHFFDEYFE